MSNPLTIIVIEKTGKLKESTIKNFDENELYKKCGYKKKENFEVQSKWKINLNGKKYLIKLFGKKNGKINSENNYTFPPPIDKTILFGNCILLLYTYTNNVFNYTNLNIPIWNQIYKKLFDVIEFKYTDDYIEIDNIENNIENNIDINETYEDEDDVVEDNNNNLIYSEYTTDEENIFNIDDELEEEEYI